MKPNYALVENIASDGRVYVALGLVAVVFALAGIAWFLGRQDRREP